jgi:hypothetical protein
MDYGQNGWLERDALYSSFTPTIHIVVDSRTVLSISGRHTVDDSTWMGA